MRLLAVRLAATPRGQDACTDLRKRLAAVEPFNQQLFIHLRPDVNALGRFILQRPGKFAFV